MYTSSMQTYVIYFQRTASCTKTCTLYAILYITNNILPYSTLKYLYTLYYIYILYILYTIPYYNAYTYYIRHQ